MKSYSPRLTLFFGFACLLFLFGCSASSSEKNSGDTDRWRGVIPIVRDAYNEFFNNRKRLRAERQGKSCLVYLHEQAPEEDAKAAYAKHDYRLFDEFIAGYGQFATGTAGCRIAPGHIRSDFPARRFFNEGEVTTPVGCNASNSA